MNDELRSTAIVRVTVHDLETKYVSRHAYDALAAEVARLKEEVEEANGRAKAWCDLYQDTLMEARRFSAPGTTKETDGPKLVIHLCNQVARLRAALAALVAEGEWISAGSGKLPKKENELSSIDVAVLRGCCQNSDIPELGYFDFATSVWRNQFGTSIFDVISWRPLPSPSSPALAAAKATLAGAGEEAGG